jgi:hypothetical protein
LHLEKVKADFESMGSLFYKFPDTLDSFEWATETPTNSSLVGWYDVFFTMAGDGECRESRTTQGTMMLAERDGRLMGVVTFERTTLPASQALAFDADFTLCQKRQVKEEQSHDHEVHWQGKFWAKVIDKARTDMVHGDAQHATATLEVLKNRIGCPWQPKEDMTNQLDSFDPSILVPFSTLDEAENLVSQYQEGLSNWFASPVLFFEPGDAVLYVQWDEDHRDPYLSYFVARKKTE